MICPSHIINFSFLVVLDDLKSFENLHQTGGHNKMVVKKVLENINIFMVLVTAFLVLFQVVISDEVFETFKNQNCKKTYAIITICLAGIVVFLQLWISVIKIIGYFVIRNIYNDNRTTSDENQENNRTHRSKKEDWEDAEEKWDFMNFCEAWNHIVNEKNVITHGFALSTDLCHGNRKFLVDRCVVSPGFVMITIIVMIPPYKMKNYLLYSLLERNPKLWK